MFLGLQDVTAIRYIAKFYCCILFSVQSQNYEDCINNRAPKVKLILVAPSVKYFPDITVALYATITLEKPDSSR